MTWQRARPAQPSLPVRETVSVTTNTPTVGATDYGQTRFVTGEAVPLDVRVARLGSRTLARLIDIIVQFVLAYALTILLGILTAAIGMSGLLALDSALFAVVWIV